MKLPEKKQRWVYHAEALPQAAGEGVTRRVLAYTDGLMCVENTFEKGAVGALHHHPHTQITYVVSGAFEFTVDGVTHTVRAGDTILKEDGVEHGCRHPAGHLHPHAGGFCLRGCPAGPVAGHKNTLSLP